MSEPVVIEIGPAELYSLDVTEIVAFTCTVCRERVEPAEGCVMREGGLDHRRCAAPAELVAMGGPE